MVSDRDILKRVVLYLMQLDDELSEEDRGFIMRKDLDLFDEWLGGEEL